MRALALLLALLAGPVLAQGTVAYGRSPMGPSRITLERCEADCFARVTFDNRLTNVTAQHSGLETFTLEIEGVRVTVVVTEQAGRSPDTFSVTPPPGFQAEPSHLSVGDDHAGTIVINPVPMS